jgi:hypothetical protein
MIYVGQNAFRLQVETGVDLTGASSSLIKIRYASPSLSTGEYDGTVLVSTAGSIYKDFTSSMSLEKGEWVFWAYVTWADSRVSIGDPFPLTVMSEGQL